MKQYFLLLLFLFASIIFFLEKTEASSLFLCTTKTKSTLRANPSTKSSKLRILSKYTPLEQLKEKSNWFYVRGFDYKGYIHKSLVTDKYRCMIMLNEQSPNCSTKKMKLNRKILFQESFKILKQEIACNYVQEKWGRKLWISSTNIWPRENAKLLIIKARK